MRKKGENHIWPAYVDMMTVLLLVYVLVSLLFAMMIQQTEASKYQEKLDYLMSLTPSEREVEIQSQQNAYLGHEGDSLVKAPKEVAVDTHNDMLTAQPNDLVLSLPSDEALTDSDKAALTKWYQLHQAEIAKQGLYLGVMVQKKDDVSMGALYRKQYLFYMDAMRVLTQLDPYFNPASFTQRSPQPSSAESTELLRFRVAPEP
ncbi:MAG: hypothetical protein PV362_19645 [Providencia heimbachae]|nr:hypothetical protein [Providencia heimbachae]